MIQFLKIQQENLNRIQNRIYLIRINDMRLNQINIIKRKYESNLGIDKLSLRQVKEHYQLNERYQQQIKELLEDKEQQQIQITQKDNAIKELRFQNEQLHKCKQSIIETLTQELEIERINRRKLQQETDDLESSLSLLFNKCKSNGTSIKDQDLIDLQNRLNEYIRLCEDEKDQKKKLSQNQMIQQFKLNKKSRIVIKYMKIELRIQEWIKEEKGMKSKQSMKIKAFYTDVEEMKLELNIL